VLVIALATVACARPPPAAPRYATFRARVIALEDGVYCQHFEPGGGYGCYERVVVEIVSPAEWRGRRFARLCTAVRPEWRAGEVTFVAWTRALARGVLAPEPPVCVRVPW